MTTLPTSQGWDWARILAGIGGGLQQAGMPNGNFSAGIQQGAGFYDQGQDRKRQQERDKLTDELRQLQIDQARTANSDAAAEKQRIADFIASKRGPQMPNNGRPGGMSTPGPMDPYWTPERLDYIEAYPDQADEIIGAKLFPGDGEPVKGVEIAGRLVNPITGEEIADFSEQELALKRAGMQPPQPPAPPEALRLMQAAGIDPSSPEGQALIRQKLAGSGGIQISGYDDQGRPLISIGGPGGKPLTEVQSTGTMQFSLADQANKTLGAADEVLTSPTDFVASKFGTVGNYFKSPEYQKAEQSATVLAEQYLRALTGAAAPEPEVQRTAKSILPQPGDSKETIAQKRATRQTIIEALRLKAGPGADKVQTEQAPDAAQTDYSKMSDEDLLKTLGITQ